MTIDKIPVFLDDKQVAAMLGISRGCLRNWRTAKAGPPYVKMGEKSVRYTLDAITEWVESNKKQTPAHLEATLGEEERKFSINQVAEAFMWLMDWQASGITEAERALADSLSKNGVTTLHLALHCKDSAAIYLILKAHHERVSS